MSPLNYEKVKAYIAQQQEILKVIPLKEQLQNKSKEYDDLLALIEERNQRVYTIPQLRKYSSHNNNQNYNKHRKYSNQDHIQNQTLNQNQGLRSHCKNFNNNNYSNHKKPYNHRKNTFQQQNGNNQDNDNNNNFGNGLISKAQECEEVKEIKQKLLESQNQYLEGQKNKSDEQKLVSEIRFKLNSLSPDNLETVQEKITDLLSKITILQFQEQISEQIVKKAIDDEKYSQTFAKLFDYIFQKNDKIKKLILKHLEKLFKGQKKLHVSKKSLEEMSETEESDFLQKRRRKFLQLANLIGNLYNSNVLPIKFMDSFLYRALQNMCGQYDLFLHLQKQNKKEDLEDDYNYLDYLEFLITALDKSGPRMEQQFNNKLKTSNFNEKLGIERNQILGLNEYLIETRQTMGDPIMMIEDLDLFNQNSEKKSISIQGYFHILDICCNLNSSNSNNLDLKNVKIQIGEQNCNESYEENINQFKEQSQEIADVRLQVIIQNLKERRKEGWEIRKHTKNNTAVTKKEIQDEIYQLKLQKEQSYQNKIEQNQKQGKFINVDYDEDDFDDDEEENEQEDQDQKLTQLNHSNSNNDSVENCITQNKQQLTAEMRED